MESYGSASAPSPTVVVATTRGRGGNSGGKGWVTWLVLFLISLSLICFMLYLFLPPNYYPYFGIGPYMTPSPYGPSTYYGPVTPSPAAPSGQTLTGSWAGYNSAGKKLGYDWRITQNGTKLDIYDANMPSIKSTGSISGDTVSAPQFNLSGMATTDRRRINWSDGSYWTKA